MTVEILFRYFKCVPGKVVPRFGTESFIGVKRDKDHGWAWDEEAVMAIPATEIRRYIKEYNRALREGSLVEVDSSAIPPEPAPEKPVRRGRRRNQ